MKERIIPNVLVIDDEMDFYEKFYKAQDGDFRMLGAPDYKTAVTKLNKYPIDLILLDLALEGNGDVSPGLNLIKPLKDQWNLPLIIVTSDTKTRTVMAAMSLGADYYLQKAEFDPKLWKKVINAQIASDGKEDIVKPKQKSPKVSQKQTAVSLIEYKEDGFITFHPPLIKIKDSLKHIATNYPNASILLLGETGVGKEVFAHFIHQMGLRKKEAFVPVNMTSLNQSLWERELFGHEKGAFTGAEESTPGYFENADKGILFLDEIGEISLDMQVKLLRVIQNHTIRRLGAKKDKKLDLQIVFATNQNLEKLVAEGKMREDFYHRISQYPIHIPPLRDRSEDIRPLLNYFLSDSKICPKIDPFHGRDIAEVMTTSCLDLLQEYHWPGNVRELQNCCRQMVIKTNLAGEKLIDISALPVNIYNHQKQDNLPLAKPNHSLAVTEVEINNNNDLEYQEAYRKLQAFENALKQFAGRKNDAAQSLGLKNDQNLRYRIKKKWFIKFPDLFDQFPTIKRAYKL